jgi:hypothetical protein
MAHLVQSVAVRHVDSTNAALASSLSSKLLTVPRGLAVCADVSGGGWRKRKRGSIEAVISPETTNGAVASAHKFMGCSMSPLMHHVSDQALTVAGMCEVYFLGDQALNTRTLGTPVYVANTSNTNNDRGRFAIEKTKASTGAQPVGFFVHPTSAKSGMIYVQAVQSQRALRLRESATKQFNDLKVLQGTNSVPITTDKEWSVMPLEERIGLLARQTAQATASTPGGTGRAPSAKAGGARVAFATKLRDELKLDRSAFPIRENIANFKEDVGKLKTEFAKEAFKLGYSVNNRKGIKARALELFEKIFTEINAESDDEDEGTKVAEEVLERMDTLQLEDDKVDYKDDTARAAAQRPRYERGRGNTFGMFNVGANKDAMDAEAAGEVRGEMGANDETNEDAMDAETAETAGAVDEVDVMSILYDHIAAIAHLVQKPAAALAEQISNIVEGDLYELAAGLAGMYGDAKVMDSVVVDTLMTNVIRDAFVRKIKVTHETLPQVGAEICASVIAAKGSVKFLKRLKALVKSATKEIEFDGEDVKMCMAELGKVFSAEDDKLKDDMRDVCKTDSDSLDALTECVGAETYFPRSLVEWCIARMIASNDESLTMFKKKIDGGEEATAIRQRCLVVKFLRDNFADLRKNSNATRPSPTSAFHT